MSLSVSDNPLDFLEEMMIDKLFTNCDDDSSGKVSITKLINYLKQLTSNNSIDFAELDDLSSLLNSFADHNTLDIQSYRQAMTEWIGTMRQPSENYSDMLVQMESLCNQNNLLNDELDRLRQLLEIAEDSFAASMKETVELRGKMKKLQNVVEKKETLQRENEDLKSIVHYRMEKFEKERALNENQRECILLENSKLKKNLEQNVTDYQNSLNNIQELKMQNSKILKKKKIEIEKLSDNFEIEIIKLKTELNKAGENVTLLKKTNKELQTTNFDLVAQIIQLKEDKSKFPEVACPILPVVIEEDMDIHQQKNITEKVHSDVSFNQSSFNQFHSINTLSSELKGMVGEFLPSPICEREHLSDSPDSNPAESRDSMLANLTTFKDILQSTVETVIEIKKQLVNFADKMEFKINKDVNCVSCSEFRLNLLATLSQYNDWVELLVCKKTTLNSWVSKIIKILTDSLIYSFEDTNDGNTNTPEHDVELAKLKVIFKTIAVQLQKLSKPTVETDKDVEKKIWLLIMQYFLSEENYCGYLIQWANLEVTEKYDRAELRNYNYHHRTSKALPEYSSGRKYGPSELEAYGTPLKLGRVLNVKEIWHLVQEEVEKKYLSDKKEYSNSTEWKDEIGKKIDGLQQRLYRKPAVFSALNSGSVAHSWQPDQRSCLFQTTHPSPTPLVDALTIERFDNGSLTQRNNKTEVFRDFNIHESYNKDHAASCPTLDEKCNFVASATQTDNLAYHFLYNHLNSSNSSSTSGVIDVDFSSSSSRSQDGQKKRKDFIRSSHKFESDSQTSQSMESNPENGASLPRQRSPSFRAAIESRSNIHLLPIGDDAQINRKSSNYLTATQYQSNNHNEFIQCSRNRSLSFQAAIEDGQHSPIDTNDIDIISTSADTTPDNPNLAEGFTLDMYGKMMLSSGRTDSRSVNFQLNTIETDIRTEPLTSGNISQSLKSSDDVHSCHGSLLKSDEWKKNLRTGLNQEVEVSVTYASPSTSLDSSGSDVPKKSCIRDSNLLRSGSNTEGVQIVNTSETSFKTCKTPEAESEMSPKKHLQSRNIRKIGVHSLEFSKEAILQEENADSDFLKVANNKDLVICTQKQQEINSTPKAAEETAVNKISGSENIDVAKNSKPDDIFNHRLGTSDNTSQLSKLREPPCLTSNETNSTLCLKVLRKKDNNLARKREQMKHMKMPELTELAENASECNDASKANAFSLANTFLQPPAPSDNMVLPSISDAFLMELGVFVDQYANFGSEDLTEQETENKFLSLSLAFKTDKQTLNQRLQIQKNSRDLAEDNVEKELKCLREASESLLQLSNDPQIRDAVKNIQHYIDVLEQAVARISGRAEVFGAVQQEERMSRAMEIMMSYVENLKRIREREHLELEEAKTLIDNKILNPEAGGDSSTLPRRATSLSNVPSKTTKRRASVAAVSKNPTPGGSVPGNPTSMGIMNKQEVYHRRSTLPAGKLLRRVNSFEKDQNPYEDSNDKEIIHRNHSLEQTLDETKEEKEENDFQVGFRRGLAIKMDNMFEGLIQQQSNLVQHVQNMMVKSDLENASDVKLTLFAEVIREFQNDITSIWKGLNPFTQYTSIFIFAILTLVAIFLPMFRHLNIAVDEKYYDMPPS